MTTLQRHLGTADATVVGLGAMLGAGIFAAFAPAARAAGAGLLLGLVIAGLVAYCNAVSSARLAANHPQSGGTYVYGRRRLGPFWGHLAGWSFVVGKTASCAAMALTFAAYAVPSQPRLAAAAGVITLTALTLSGVQKSMLATRVIVAVVLLLLAVVVVVCAAGGVAATARLDPLTGTGVHGVLQAAGFLFFAFAGYARIATLGEEVRDPARTIPRAVTTSLGVTLVVYAAVALAALYAAGAPALAASSAPLRTAVEAAGAPALGPVVRVGAALAALGSLLALLLGVSRTTLAMARDRHLPRALAAVDEQRSVPRNAELAVAAAVLVLVLTLDVRAAIGFSSFAVLLYYAVANAAAWTLGGGAVGKAVPALGLAGCALLAVFLPVGSLLAGAAVVAVGAGIYLARRVTAR